MTNDGPPRLRAAFITNGNPRDVATWSNIPWHMLRALESRVDMVVVVERPWASWFFAVGKLLKGLSLRRFEYIFSRWYTRLGAAPMLAQLRAARPDVVFAVSASPLAHLLVDDFRVINIADATVRVMVGYYDSYSALSSTGRRGADALEARLIAGAFLSAYPSAWACRSALDDYGADPSRVTEIAWGANIETRASAARMLPDGPIHFLFVGIDWPRKGGPLALAVVAELTRRGIDCRLDIVGVDASVAKGPLPANVRFHGFVSKAEPAGRVLIEQLYASAHFFLLPTLAECFGIVFAEAAAQALPAITHATGGLPSVVKNGKTGLLLPLGASADAFAAAIASIIAEPGCYAAMSAATLADSQKRLNWERWAETLVAEVEARLP